MLRYEVPVVYEVLMHLLPFSSWPEPPYPVVKAVCEASTDQSLRKAKYFRYLEEYRTMGLYCRRPKRLTPGRRAYYRRLQDKKIARYIEENRARIQAVENMKNIDSKFAIWPYRKDCK